MYVAEFVVKNLDKRSLSEGAVDRTGYVSIQQIYIKRFENLAYFAPLLYKNRNIRYYPVQLG